MVPDRALALGELRTRADRSGAAVPALYVEHAARSSAANIVGTLLSCSLVAYAFARLRFRGSELLFNILIITMLIPWQVLMIPQFLMFHKLGWYGTYLPLIVPSFTGNAFFIFLIRQYMRSSRASSTTRRRSTAATTGRSSGTSFCRCACRCWPWCGVRLPGRVE